MLKALAHPARIAILQQIINAKACICGDLSTELGLAQPTISQHLKELKNAGLIQGTIEGVSVCYCINPVKWAELKEQLAGFLDSADLAVTAAKIFWINTSQYCNIIFKTWFMNTFPRMHVSLYVGDLAKTIDFYSNFFGLAPQKVKPGYAKYILDEPSLIISFVENPGRVRQNFGHLGFQVETLAELNERLEHARQSGLVTREETGTNCCYASQDKFWVSDPDGVQWEVYYFHADAEFNDPHYELTSAPACCMPQQAEAAKPAFKNLAVAAECCTPGNGICC